MPKVKGPLFSGDARGKFGEAIIFTRGGGARRYFKPRNPATAAQEAHRIAFKEYYMAALTQAQADLLYAAIAHLHDETYSPLEHLHDGDYLREAFPVGSIFLSTVATDPATLLGYGTWEAFGSGRVLIGQDTGQSEFNVLEETGGEKSHAHDLSNAGHAKVSIQLAASPNIHFERVARSWTANVGAGFTNNPASSNASQSYGVGLGGVTDAEATLPPYIVVKMWKRVS